VAVKGIKGNLLTIFSDGFAKNRHPGENRGPGIFKEVEVPGFQRWPE
jgi:hypothetical protein